MEEMSVRLGILYFPERQLLLKRTT